MRPLATAPNLLRPDRRAVTWAFLLLAFGIAISLPWSVRDRAQPVTRQAEREPAFQSIAHLENEQRELKEQIALLRVRLSETQNRQADHRVTLSALEQDLKTQQMLAGLTPLAGTGVVITLADSTNTAPTGSAASDYIIHDTDVRDVLNTLWSAGAEAIAVNNERLVATSSVVCVGTVIIVNDTRLAPPYKITAIGDQAHLVEALDTEPHLAPLRRRVRDVGVQLKTSPGATVEVPAYKGTFVLRHAAVNQYE